MQKVGLTFYLPRSMLQQVKIEAVRQKLSLSDFISDSVLAFIKKGNFSTGEPPSSKESTKVFIYLYPETKVAIKKTAALHSITVSDLLYQALSFYFANKDDTVLPASKENFHKPNQQSHKSKKKNIQTNPFVYRLTAENEAWIRIVAAERLKSRKEIIFEAIDKADSVQLANLKATSSQNVRTSMRLNKKEEAFLRNTAKKLELNVSEMINKALYIIRNQQN